MFYEPHSQIETELLDFFESRKNRYPAVHEKLHIFFTQPNLPNAQSVLQEYFKHHEQGDIEILRKITSAFADKALVRDIVDSILDDDQALEDIAARSYPHPIGFDKLVLYQDEKTGFKFRLHIYWRSREEQAQMERMHLHKFEMASAIVTGELTNHIWEITDYDAQSDEILPSMDTTTSPFKKRDGDETKYMQAYSGYWRDDEGVLHKKFLGPATLKRATSRTFSSSQSYAQLLEHAHYVETNAETGHTNGDHCSTIYIHGPKLKDGNGRDIPVLFEEERLENDDQIITPIPSMTKESLKSSLNRYRNLLQESLDFYEFLYDPKHGRNLSVGMIAGYLLSERYQTPHTATLWEHRYEECRETLAECTAILSGLINGDHDIAQMSEDDRTKRYYAMLLKKAEQHPDGTQQWFKQYGNLTKELWRYFGALRGEKDPDITVLKPVWQDAVGKKLPGGMHYGHISAMIEAAFEGNKLAMKHFGKITEDLGHDKDGPVSIADYEIDSLIRNVLHQHYPQHTYTSEHVPPDPNKPPQKGDVKFIVDPIDGTTNFLNGNENFGISIACQEFDGQNWITTDAVVSIPSSGKIFWAEKGQGAFLIERNDYERRIWVSGPANNNDPVQLKPTSQQEPLKGKTIDLSMRGLGGDGWGGLLADLFNDSAKCRISGSAAISLARVSGTGHKGSLVTAKPHDIAAGKLIAQEAGATISEINFQRNIDGKPYQFNALIAGDTAEIHDALRSATQKQIRALSH